MSQLGEAYVRDHQVGDDEDIRAFRLGAILAQDPNRHGDIQGFTDEEKMILSKEVQSRWSQPKLLYLVIILCSTCAAVQGMGMQSSVLHLKVNDDADEFQTRPSSTVRRSSIAHSSVLAARRATETLG